MPKDIHHVYKTSLKWMGEKKGALSVEGNADLDVSPPSQFGGPEGFWSPEDLFLASVEVCTMMTFLAIIRRREIELESYESEAEGVLETTDEGIRFTSITIKPKVKVKNPEDAEMVEALLERAHKHCLITRSMEVGVRVEIV